MRGAPPSAVLCWSAGVGLLVTLSVAFTPGARFAYENPSLHIALETAEGLIACLLAYLAVGRLRTTCALRDLAMAMAFGTFAVGNLFGSAVPAVALQEQPGGFVTWMALAVRLVGAVWFLWAAVAGPSTITVDRRLGRRVLAVAAATLTGALLAAGAADVWLAEGVRGVTPQSSSTPQLVGHPLVLVAQLFGAACFAVAALSFDRRAVVTGDRLLHWLAAGAALSAASRLSYAFFPSLYSQWVYVGDLLRLASYLLFLVAAAREIRSYWHDRAQMEITGERQRIARELHDGLAQELAFIRSQTAAMAAGTSIPGMEHHLHAAAERALVESRRAVQALADEDRQPIADTLRRAAEEVGVRAGLSVRLEGSGTVTAAGPVREALARVTREAASNAARHGGAATLTVRVQPAEGGLHLTVADDGRGFDPATVRRGFGLRSMRERVEALGGRFDVRSCPGEGTAIDARVPDAASGGTGVRD